MRRKFSEEARPEVLRIARELLRYLASLQDKSGDEKRALLKKRVFSLVEESSSEDLHRTLAYVPPECWALDIMAEVCEGPSALSMEKYLVSHEEWPFSELPVSVQDQVNQAQREGISVGVGRHPTEGVFVLVTQGQGPILIWANAWVQEDPLFPDIA